jgi:putative transcriptional regulator
LDALNASHVPPYDDMQENTLYRFIYPVKEYIAPYMIRVKLRSALEEASFKKGERVTHERLARETGISRTTLARMANLPGHNVELSAIDALCRYFKCQPGELLEYVPDSQVKSARRRY